MFQHKSERFGESKDGIGRFAAGIRKVKDREIGAVNVVMTVNEQESHGGMLAQACGTPTEFWCGATILSTTCHPEAAERGEGPRSCSQSVQSARERRWKREIPPRPAADRERQEWEREQKAAASFCRESRVNEPDG
jgi:hypothetical protein